MERIHQQPCFPSLPAEDFRMRLDVTPQSDTYMNTFAETNDEHSAIADDLELRITRLPEDWRNIVYFYSGNRPDGRRVLTEKLEAHCEHSPNIPLLTIQRKLPHKGRRGGILEVSCGLCSKTGKLYQKIAEHIISEHFGLSLWHCPTCRISCRRLFDLHRHRESHGAVRPWKAKGLGKHRRANTISLYPTQHSPSPVPAISIPVPSRSETIPNPRLYSGPRWPAETGNAPDYAQSTSGSGKTLSAGQLSGRNIPTGSSTMPRNLASHSRGPSTTSNGYLCVPAPYPNRSRRSSHSSMTSSTSEAAGLSGSEYGTTYTSPPSLSNSPMQPWAGLDGSSGSSYSSSEFLAPALPAIGGTWSPLQGPMYREPAPSHGSNIRGTSQWSYDGDSLSSPTHSTYSTYSGMPSPIIPSSPYAQDYPILAHGDMQVIYPRSSSGDGDQGTAQITDGLGLFSLNASEGENGFKFGASNQNLKNAPASMDQSGPNTLMEGASKDG